MVKGAAVPACEMEGRRGGESEGAAAPIEKASVVGRNPVLPGCLLVRDDDVVQHDTCTRHAVCPETEKRRIPLQDHEPSASELGTQKLHSRVSLAVGRPADALCSHSHSHSFPNGGDGTGD